MRSNDQLDKNLFPNFPRINLSIALGPVRRGIHRDGWAAATRKPRLLFRFSGAFLLRFAGRQFLALLFQLPPRITRYEALVVHRQRS